MLELDLAASDEESLIRDGLHEFLDGFQGRLTVVDQLLAEHIFRVLPSAVSLAVRISLDWESTYYYSQPVRLLHTELRVLPADRAGQRLRSGSVALAPTATAHELRDMFGNAYHHVDFLEEVDQITVAVQAEVETELAGSDDEAGSPLLGHLYLASTERAPIDHAIAMLTDGVPTDLDPVATGRAFCRLFGEQFVFEVGSTDVAATALDLLDLRRGVCQDFSHLMRRAAPARYPRPLRERLPRAGAGRAFGGGLARLGAAVRRGPLARIRSGQ